MRFCCLEQQRWLSRQIQRLLQIHLRNPPAPQSQSHPTENSAQKQTPPSGANNNQPNASSSQAPASANTPSQASQPQNQNSNPTANNNHPQQAPDAKGNNTTAQQPNTQNNTAQSSSTNVNASVNINDQQRIRISQSVARLNVHPLTNVNFSLSVGAAIPRDIRLSPLPAEIVEIVPQYRNYNFVLVKDEIVIVDPSSYQIITILPASGRPAAAAPAPKGQRHTNFTDRDREVIRKHVHAQQAEGRTIGSSVSKIEVRMGERIPDSVEIEALPEAVYRKSPTLREYRFIHRDSRTYVVEPQERRVIEVID